MQSLGGSLQHDVLSGCAAHCKIRQERGLRLQECSPQRLKRRHLQVKATREQAWPFTVLYRLEIDLTWIHAVAYASSNIHRQNRLTSLGRRGLWQASWVLQLQPAYFLQALLRQQSSPSCPPQASYARHSLASPSSGCPCARLVYHRLARHLCVAHWLVLQGQGVS